MTTHEKPSTTTRRVHRRRRTLTVAATAARGDDRGGRVRRVPAGRDAAGAAAVHLLVRPGRLGTGGRSAGRGQAGRPGRLRGGAGLRQGVFAGDARRERLLLRRHRDRHRTGTIRAQPAARPLDLRSVTFQVHTWYKGGSAGTAV